MPQYKFSRDLISERELNEVLKYIGPERRTQGSPLWRILAAVLDEVDYGLMLVADAGRVIHANHVARRLLEGGQVLALEGGHLMARDDVWHGRLGEAISAAQLKDTRSMLHIADGEGGHGLGLSVVPLHASVQTESRNERPVLITLQRAQLVETLSVGAFARQYSLSPREEEVLGLLCAGRRPAEIAEQLCLSGGTIRTHIHNLKAKAGCNSMVELVKRVAVLPPIVSALKTPPLQDGSRKRH